LKDSAAVDGIPPCMTVNALLTLPNLKHAIRGDLSAIFTNIAKARGLNVDKVLPSGLYDALYKQFPKHSVDDLKSNMNCNMAKPQIAPCTRCDTRRRNPREKAPCQMSDSASCATMMRGQNPAPADIEDLFSATPASMVAGSVGLSPVARLDQSYTFNCKY